MIFIKDQFYNNPIVINIRKIIYPKEGEVHKNENILKFYEEVLEKAFRIYEKNDQKNIDFLLSTMKCLKNEENSNYLKSRKFLKTYGEEKNVLKNYFKI